MSDDDFPDDDLPSDDPGSEEEEEFTLEELDAMPQTSASDNDFALPGVSVDVFENTLDELRSKFSGSKGRKQATERLLRDFAVVKHSNTVDLGYEAGPVGDDLYHWIVRLFNFEGEMASDLARYASATGKPPHVELEITFPEDYPIEPPFVRVVRPRFQFHRGHVTIGGSICMELLTRSGWSPCNDIDTVLVQIRSEMIAGNARLDHAQMTRDYTLQEAKEAFTRVARQHGWQ